MTAQPVPPCALCLKQLPLQQSHVIPEFMYQPLYDANHRARVLTNDAAQGTRPKYLQKGLRVPLLCFDCEQHINDTCEKPMKAMWVDHQPYADPMIQEHQWVLPAQPDAFRRFHLSVLFRAAAARTLDSAWKNVFAENHLPDMRTALLGTNPISPRRFPIACWGIVDQKLELIPGLVVPPVDRRVLGVNAFYFIYGGFGWLYWCGSHFDEQIATVMMQPDGKIPIGRTHFAEVGHLCEVAFEHLRRVGKASTNKGMATP